MTAPAQHSAWCYKLRDQHITEKKRTVNVKFLTAQVRLVPFFFSTGGSF